MAALQDGHCCRCVRGSTSGPTSAGLLLVVVVFFLWGCGQAPLTRVLYANVFEGLTRFGPDGS